MKNFLLLILTLGLTSNIFAQIPNGDFESWTTVGTYEDPTGWGTANSFTSSLSIFTCTKTTDAFQGTYAADLNSQFALITTVPGVMGSNASINLTSFQILGGYPSTSRFAWLSGYYKSAPTGGDTDLVAAVLTKWNTSLGKKDTIAIALMKETATVSSYTRFQVPFVYFSTANPDTAIVIGATTTNLLSAHTGTELKVDSLTLFGVYTDVNEIENKVEVKLFPNPVASMLHINLNSTAAGEIEITDVTGRVILVKQISEPDNMINVADLANGLYGFNFRNENGAVLCNGNFVVSH